MKKRKKMAKKGKIKARIVKKRKIKVTKKLVKSKKIVKRERKMPKVIGKVFTYYPNISVIAVKLSDKLRLGDKILIKGEKTNFEQKVESMQIEHKSVKEAKKGSDVGIKVIDVARQNDVIYRL